MSDYKELIAEAREFASWIEPSQGATSDLMLRLADALEAAGRGDYHEGWEEGYKAGTGGRAVVEAQALEQAAERMRAAHGNIWGADWIAKTLIAWAAEIREGRA